MSHERDKSTRAPAMPGKNEGGYVLLAVTVFVFVLIIAGLAMFSTASYETRLSMHDQESAQAFYLADAAVERARAKLLDDRTWRDGWSDVALGGGTYDLTISDTTLISEPSEPYVKLIATGHYGNADRRIMTVGKLTPAALEVALLTMGDFDASANVCISGRVHVNGVADFGNDDNHLACGDLSEGFTLRPPQIYVDAAHMPGSTYYDVRASLAGGVPQATVYDRNGNDITASLPENPTDVLTYNNATGRFYYNFGDPTTLDNFFRQTTGVFSRDVGDMSVVVNFGGSSPTNPNAIADMVLRGSGSVDLNTTVVNTRFIGTTDDQRLDPTYWAGGTTTVERIVIEPYNGFTLICHEMICSNAVTLGTATNPGLVYITGGINVTNSSHNIFGSLICMGDFSTNAEVDFTYDPSFLSLLPDYIADEWVSMVSGTLRPIYWREVAAN